MSPRPSSQLRTKRNHARFAPLALVLLLALPAGAQDRDPRFKDTSNPTVPPPTRFEAGMDSPQERFRAIGPLLDRSTLESERAVESATQRRARELGVSKTRLALWSDLFFNNGASGLGTLAPADLAAYAKDLAGTWELTARVIEGREVRAQTIYIWELLELSDEHAVFNTLLLEVGVFEKWLDLPPANGESYLIGSFGKVVLELIEGDESLGLVEGESAIRQTWNGEILGDNYPGTEKLVAIEVESFIVHQGSRYNQAWATVHINELNQRPSDYQTVQLVPAAGSDSSVWVSHRFDSEDDYEKVSDGVPFQNLEAYWQRAKRRPSVLLSPEAVTNPRLVRKVMQEEP